MRKSKPKAISKPKPKLINPHTPIKSAFRSAVSVQISLFKHENWYEGFICPLTEQPCKKSNVEVDHIYEFRFLLQDFLNKKKLAIGDVKIAYDKGRPVLLDQQLSIDWQAYHHKHATLRLTSRAGNRQRPRKKPTP